MRTYLVTGLLTLYYGSWVTQALPAWSDIFSALIPYQDPYAPAPAYVPMASGKELTEEDIDEYNSIYPLDEDQGSPRFGIVQLGSGGAAYNVTLDLTGQILMGLGIASALAFYLFIRALNDRGGSYDRNDRAKRDLSSYLDNN